MPPRFGRLKRLMCCPPPPRVAGLVAEAGGGSGEVFVAWTAQPPSSAVAFYRVYRQVRTGVWRQLAAVTDAAVDANFPGKVVLLDTPENFPGSTDFGSSGERTYVVAAVGTSGLEGAWSLEVIGTPP